MADETISLAEGGVVTLVLAKGVDCPAEYLHHPSVRVLEAAKFDASDVERCFTSNSRALITTANLPKPFYDRLQMEVRRRKTILMYRPTTGSIENELNKIVATSRRVIEHAGNGNGAGLASVGETARVTEANGKKTMAPRNAIATLAQQADPSKSTGEEARRLFKVAQDNGIPTTVASISTAISSYKRKHGLSDRPSSAVPATVNKRLQALRVLDDAIAGLALVREYVETVETENAQLTERLEKFQKLAAAINE